MKTSRASRILDVINYIKKILTFSGIWPSRNPTWAERLANLFTCIVDVSIQVFLFAELYKILRNGEYKRLTDLLSFMTSFVSWVIKRSIFALKYNTFMKILDSLEDPVFHDFPRVCNDHVWRENAFSMRLINAYHFFAVNMVTTSIFRPLMGNDLCIPFSLFELGSWYYVLHFYQIVIMAVSLYNNTAMDCVTMSLMSFSSTQFEILKEKIMNCRKWAGLTTEEIDSGLLNCVEDMNTAFDEVVNEYLGSCVEHHLKIFGLVGDIEEVFSYILLSQFSASVLAICNTFFQFLFADSVSQTMFLICYGIALLIQLILYCFYGNVLMVKSEEVRKACYFSEWYKSNKKVRKTIMLIMERSKRPVYITAGKFATVDLASYTALLRSSYSYFALMNRLYDK